jgi:hypothetical protein
MAVVESDVVGSIEMQSISPAASLASICETYGRILLREKRNAGGLVRENIIDLAAGFDFGRDAIGELE